MRCVALREWGVARKPQRGIPLKVDGRGDCMASSASDCSVKFRVTDDALEGLASETMTDRHLCEVSNYDYCSFNYYTCLHYVRLYGYTW